MTILGQYWRMQRVSVWWFNFNVYTSSGYIVNLRMGLRFVIYYSRYWQLFSSVSRFICSAMLLLELHWWLQILLHFFPLGLCFHWFVVSYLCLCLSFVLIYQFLLNFWTNQKISWVYCFYAVSYQYLKHFRIIDYITKSNGRIYPEELL